MNQEPPDAAAQAVVRRLRSLDGVSREAVWYEPDCFMLPFAGGGVIRARKLITIREEGKWLVRAGVRRLPTNEPQWSVWRSGWEFDKRNLESLIKFQFDQIESFERRSKLLREDGVRVAGLVLKEAGLVMQPEMLSWLTGRWIVDVPWVEGSAWEWWRLASGDIELKMKQLHTGLKRRFEIRARAYGAFETILGTMRGGR